MRGLRSYIHITPFLPSIPKFATPLFLTFLMTLEDYKRLQYYNYLGKSLSNLWDYNIISSICFAMTQTEPILILTSSHTHTHWHTALYFKRQLQESLKEVARRIWTRDITTMFSSWNIPKHKKLHGKNTHPSNSQENKRCKWQPTSLKEWTSLPQSQASQPASLAPHISFLRSSPTCTASSGFTPNKSQAFRNIVGFGFSASTCLSERENHSQDNR